jgi:hypothetical protein
MMVYVGLDGVRWSWAEICKSEMENDGSFALERMWRVGFCSRSCRCWLESGKVV